MKPMIEITDHRYRDTPFGTALPVRFIATFEDWARPVELDVTVDDDGQPTVESVTVRRGPSDVAGLKSNHLRLRITSQMLPDALRAAARVRVEGTVVMRSAEAEAFGIDDRRDLRLVVPADDEQSADLVNGNNSRSARMAEVRRAAEVYAATDSINAVKLALDVSKTTAWRRIQTAKELGFLEGGDDGAR